MATLFTQMLEDGKIRRPTPTELAFARVLRAKEGDLRLTQSELREIKVAYVQQATFTICLLLKETVTLYGQTGWTQLNIGVTKRNPNDPPDEEAAKLIAFERALLV